MKFLLENWREYLKESSKNKLMSVKDVHDLADTLNISWDDDADFMSWTEELTGKSHLDKMTNKELLTIYAALKKRRKENK